MSLRDYFVQVAKSIWFDNSTNGFTADDVQGAIEEIGASTSPGFTWGRSGNVTSGSYLLNDSVPSNKSGRTNVLGATKVVKFFSASENLDTYTLRLYWHEGDSINLTLLTTLTVTSSRTGDSGTISVSVPAGKQLAVKLQTGSAKNVVAGLIMQGDI